MKPSELTFADLQVINWCMKVTMDVITVRVEDDSNDVSRDDAHEVLLQVADVLDRVLDLQEAMQEEKTVNLTAHKTVDEYREEVKQRAQDLGVSLSELQERGDADELEDDRLRDLYLESAPILFRE